MYGSGQKKYHVQEIVVGMFLINKKLVLFKKLCDDGFTTFVWSII